MVKEVKKADHKKIRKSLKYSVVEGSFYGVTDATANTYVSPFSIAMGATNNEVALLTSVPNLVGPLSELGTTKVLERGISRKKIVMLGSLLQGLMLIPIILIPFFFLDNGPFMVVILFTLYSIFRYFKEPAWTSWIGDLVPEKKRGIFFGKRARLIGFITLIVSLAVGYFLDIFSKNQIFIGFAIIFILGFAARIISIFFQYKQFEPELKIEKKFQFSFFQFVKRMPFNNYGRFAIYITLMYIAVYLISPFIAVYLLKDLGLSYTKYTIINVMAGIASLVGLPIWGRFADKYGNIKVIKICGFLIPFVPLLWLFSSNFYYLVAIQIYSGYVWSGFNLSLANFLFDSTSVQRRPSIDAYTTLLLGLAAFIGATLGGIMATNVKVTFMNSLLFIFLISSILRLITSIVMLPKINEIREMKRVSLLNIIGLSHRGFHHKAIGWNDPKKK